MDEKSGHPRSIYRKFYQCFSGRGIRVHFLRQLDGRRHQSQRDGILARAKLRRRGGRKMRGMLAPVKSYLASQVQQPYFLFVSDGMYMPVLDVMKILGMDVVPISSFCRGDDKIPSIDGLLSYIKLADLTAVGKKIVVTGLGEFLALRGSEEAKRALSMLKDLNVGSAKVILLLRGLSSLISGLESDPRFDDRRHSVLDGARCNLSFTIAAPSVGLSALPGFKAMLAELEKGRSGHIVATTAVNLDKAILTVHQDNVKKEGDK